jgi:hypothetical protein
MRSKTVKKYNKKRGGMKKQGETGADTEILDPLDALERGPVRPLQRIRTAEMGPNPNTIEDFERRVREYDSKPISVEETELEFARGPPQERERRERDLMSDEDSREDPFLARMPSWGKYETGGRKRRTIKNKRKSKKTMKKSRKYKSRSRKNINKRRV